MSKIIFTKNGYKEISNEDFLQDQEISTLLGSCSMFPAAPEEDDFGMISYGDEDPSHTEMLFLSLYAREINKELRALPNVTVIYDNGFIVYANNAEGSIQLKSAYMIIVKYEKMFVEEFEVQ